MSLERDSYQIINTRYNNEIWIVMWISIYTERHRQLFFTFPYWDIKVSCNSKVYRVINIIIINTLTADCGTIMYFFVTKEPTIHLYIIVIYYNTFDDIATRTLYCSSSKQQYKWQISINRHLLLYRSKPLTFNSIRNVSKSKTLLYGSQCINCNYIRFKRIYGIYIYSASQS